MIPKHIEQLEQEVRSIKDFSSIFSKRPYIYNTFRLNTSYPIEFVRCNTTPNVTTLASYMCKECGCFIIDNNGVVNKDLPCPSCTTILTTDSLIHLKNLYNEIHPEREYKSGFCITTNYPHLSNEAHDFHEKHGRPGSYHELQSNQYGN